MQKHAVPLIVALSVFGLASPAVYSAAEQLPPFDQVDSNKDGSISQDEAQQAGILSGDSFSKADSDGNGQVSQSEYQSWEQQQGGGSSGGSMGGGSGT